MLNKSTEPHRSSSKQGLKKGNLNTNQSRTKYAVKKCEAYTKKNYLSKTSLVTPY